MKSYAIRENHLYNKVFRKGKKYVGRLVAVYVLKDYAASRLAKANPEKKYFNRVGLSVSKKLGGAVVRNRAKRIVRAAYAELRDELRTGYLIVISPRGAATDKKSTDVEAELRRAFEFLDMTISDQTQK